MASSRKHSLTTRLGRPTTFEAPRVAAILGFVPRVACGRPRVGRQELCSSQVGPTLPVASLQSASVPCGRFVLVITIAPWERTSRRGSTGYGSGRTQSMTSWSANPRLEPTGLAIPAPHEHFCAGGSGTGRSAFSSWECYDARRCRSLISPRNRSRT